jgi:2-aminomuconate deaminase
VGPRQPNSEAIPGVELNADGTIATYDIEVQTRSVLDNVLSVLNAAGLGYEHLADITVFLTNMKDDFASYNKIYAEILSAYKPCRTTVEVGALPTPIGIELKCIAVFPD